jgi:hypothetical protein
VLLQLRAATTRCDEHTTTIYCNLSMMLQFP